MDDAQDQGKVSKRREEVDGEISGLMGAMHGIADCYRELGLWYRARLQRPRPLRGEQHQHRQAAEGAGDRAGHLGSRDRSEGGKTVDAKRALLKQLEEDA
ncbi:hypothetical protein [Streptomyces sp. S186]|uniref:hypothetical protein n=1 Tax=Streptomyces sp. S186 TaxID=3434395 RepID=UPI003F66412C